jgi:hypothetical protein
LPLHSCHAQGQLKREQCSKTIQFGSLASKGWLRRTARTATNVYRGLHAEFFTYHMPQNRRWRAKKLIK